MAGAAAEFRSHPARNSVLNEQKRFKAPAGADVARTAYPASDVPHDSRNRAATRKFAKAAAVAR